MTSLVSRLLVIVGVVLAQTACAPPTLRPLGGAAPAEIRLPAGDIGPGYRSVVFRWELTDRDLLVRGEGVSRIAPPDSARLDFFLAGGIGGGRAALIGDELRTAAGADMIDRLVPPAPLLWATLGRLAVPPAADTAATVDGGLLRADIGRPVAWRVTFRGDSLVRLERVAAGRVVEWVDRKGGTVRYRHESSRRELVMTVTRTQPSTGFDASIWRP